MTDNAAQPARWKKWLRRIAFCVTLIVVGVYAIVGGALYAFQDKLIFPAQRGLKSTPAERGLTFEEVALDVAGEKTIGWYLPIPNARGTVLFSHGNGGTIVGWSRVAPFFHNLGLNALVYDPGGYGNSTGDPSEARLYADIRAMWRWLTETRGIPAGQIFIVGRSLGCAPSLDLATEVKPAAVVLESPFLSLPDQAAKMFPWFPVRLLLRTQFSNKDKIAQVNAPILIVHSTEDDLIPYAHGEGLFALAREPKTLIAITGSHNSGFTTSEAVYAPAWKVFADSVLAAK